MSSPDDNDDDDDDDRLSLAILRIVSTLTRTSSPSWTDMNSPSIAPIVRTSDQRRWLICYTRFRKSPFLKIGAAFLKIRCARFLKIWLKGCQIVRIFYFGPLFLIFWFRFSKIWFRFLKIWSGFLKIWTVYFSPIFENLVPVFKNLDRVYPIFKNGLPIFKNLDNFPVVENLVPDF